MIVIKENETQDSEAGKYAIDLWNNFFKRNSYNLKKLYSIFGINT